MEQQSTVEPFRLAVAPLWRPSWLTIAIVLLATGSLGVGLYPMTAAWMSSYNQSHVVNNFYDDLPQIDPPAQEQLQLARDYNAALTAGVVLDAGATIPVGQGVLSDTSYSYDEILRVNASGLIGRVRIPGVEVDLPIYHGTSEETLERGAGHLEGSHVPVGGDGTRSVITAHRGLASSTLFTNLDKVQVGDRFTLEVFGEVLTYEVRETKVIDPSDTDTLRAVPGRDLVTLVTCTPLGVNSHRILVTGERVLPTPIEDIEAAGEDPTIPGFPWWAVLGGAGAAAVLTYLIRRGFVDGRVQVVDDPDAK